MTAPLVAASLLFCNCIGTAHAALIATEQVAAAAEAAREPLSARGRLLKALDRKDVAAALVARGVDPVQARKRVLALTDHEASRLTEQMDSAPAGAYWLAPFFIASLVVALMYVVNRLDVLDRLAQAWANRAESARDERR